MLAKSERACTRVGISDLDHGVSQGDGAVRIEAAMVHSRGIVQVLHTLLAKERSKQRNSLDYRGSQWDRATNGTPVDPLIIFS